MWVGGRSSAPLGFWEVTAIESWTSKLDDWESMDMDRSSTSGGIALLQHLCVLPDAGVFRLDKELCSAVERLTHTTSPKK
jgi:hypothetical protein